MEQPQKYSNNVEQSATTQNKLERHGTPQNSTMGAAWDSDGIASS